MGDELDAACVKLKDAGITPITADDAYMTSFIGYHLARYIGQDGVKLVTGEEVNGQNVTWDDREFLQQLRAFCKISAKRLLTQRTLRQSISAGQNQNLPFWRCSNHYLRS